MSMGDLSSLPDEMFTIIEQASSHLRPRLGRLSLPNRHAIQTPHYLASTSRGVVPHLTPDTFERDTRISGVYVPLEDFIERAPHRTPALYNFTPSDGSSPLRRFVALPDETLLVLGARRSPPVIAPAANPNTNSTIAVSTAVGFRTLQAEDYVRTSEKLKLDIVVGLGDVPFGRALGAKRIEKATDRMIEWMNDHVRLRRDERDQGGRQGQGQGSLFAPLLPVSCRNQQFYVETLEEELKDEVDGLAVYNTDTLEDLPETLHHLPRLTFLEPTTPHQILHQISMGCDILTVPFISAATDAGIALDFSFPAPSNPHDQLCPFSLGLDMWLPSHATSLSPITPACPCYTCTNHHRAYLQHLLSAKEMLGWILLQIHNHHTVDAFFAGVRSAIQAGTFEAEARRFGEVYEPRLPDGTGRGPRVRGYQFRSEGPGEGKRNPAAFTAASMMADEGREKLADVEAALPSEGATAEVLEAEGFAEKADT